MAARTAQTQGAADVDGSTAVSEVLDGTADAPRRRTPLLAHVGAVLRRRIVVSRCYSPSLESKKTEISGRKSLVESTGL
jgi:hypothetical protein